MKVLAGQPHDRLNSWLKQLSNGTLLLIAVILLLFSVLLIRILNSALIPMPQAQLLTDPFLQLPTETSVQVVWFTDFEGTDHWVNYGQDLKQAAPATSFKLSRVREDGKSKVGTQTEENTVYKIPTMRSIWRHEAQVSGLTPGQRVPYRITSTQESGEAISSDVFTLAPQPQAGTPLKILLTSDHQLMPMTATNLQKVAETVGQVDAVFLAGDLVNIPDRASEWFDDNRGGAFFPSLQGRAHFKLERAGNVTFYKGGQIIQHAPLFPAAGNHEVMGRFSTEKSLNDQFKDAYPRAAAEKFYDPSRDGDRAEWLKNHSFNTDTYQEIFTLPQSSPGRENYYAVTFGDIRLVVLYITNIWRVPELSADVNGRYRESDRHANDPQQWGYGQHIFEPIFKGSRQYKWLTQELNSPEFQQAKYKIVMFHHPPHSLGDNIVPAYTDPVQLIDRDDRGKIKSVRYEYPKDADYIIRDVVPLLEAAKVQLVLYGHSHLWNRFVSPQGTHYLETSNVGNTYGACFGDKRRVVPQGYREEYVAVGDPNGLEPVTPAIAPLQGKDGKLLPYIASNDITAFSIFDTSTGKVSSYYFDTSQPQSSVVKFDEFSLLPSSY